MPYGLRGKLVDLDTGTAQSTRLRIARVLESVAPQATRLGASDDLSLRRRFWSGPGSDCQRYLAAREGLEGLIRRLIAETECSAREELEKGIELRVFRNCPRRQATNGATMNWEYVNVLLLCAACMLGLLRALGLGHGGGYCVHCGTRLQARHAEDCPWREL